MQDLFPIRFSWLIPTLPLIGAAVSGFFGAKWLKGKSHWPIWLGVGFSALLALCLLAQMLQRMPPSEAGTPGSESSIKVRTADEIAQLSATKSYFTWIHAGNFVVRW